MGERVSSVTGRSTINLASIIWPPASALPAGLGTSLAAEQPPRGHHQRAEGPRGSPGASRPPRPMRRTRRRKRFVDSLRNRPPARSRPAEREQIVTIAQKRPSIDLEVNFEYNSDEIGQKATPQVTISARRSPAAN